MWIVVELIVIVVVLAVAVFATEKGARGRGRANGEVLGIRCWPAQIYEAHVSAHGS